MIHMAHTNRTIQKVRQHRMAACRSAFWLPGIKLTLFVAFLAIVQFAGAQSTPPRVEPSSELFEKRIRPLFTAKCVSCHSGSSQRGGVRLDSAVMLRTTTSHGRQLVAPGKPEKSALIDAVNYTGDVKMPPSGKLSTAEIAELTAWVKSGAVWPSSSSDSSPVSASVLWSLRPVVRPGLPNTGSSGSSPIDRLVLAKLEQNGLHPSPPADRRTLLRRATYDLIGLPPTAGEIAAFEADRSPEAWPKVIDRLLADNRYGERWGRHWLDVARFADTSGDANGADNRFPYAYTYRDWVIRAINSDMPYNVFLTQQLAAGVEPLGPDKRALAATGFLTLGRSFGGNPQDIVDDRIDVVMRGTQGLTVTCARCHDHKFDPIPTRDYYSLYGIFASTNQKTSPIPASAEQMAAYTDYDRERVAREKQPTDYVEGIRRQILQDSAAHAAEYLLAAQKERSKPEGAQPTARTDNLNPVIAVRWRQYLESTRPAMDPVMTPWHAYAALKPEKFAVEGAALARAYRANADANARLNWQVAMMFAGAPPASLKELANRYGRLFADISAQWQRTLKSAAESGGAPPTSLPVPAQEAIRQLMYAENAPLNVPEFEVEQALTLAQRSKLEALRRRVNALRNSSRALPHALVLEDSPSPENAHVFVRGDADNPGEEVPRRFLSALGGTSRKSFGKGSGRLELAQAITDPHNPLTARVLVNRVWMYHFGFGIVRTTGDFGSRGELPTHPELLDWLASEFMEQGWSLKHLHRTILLSSVYQQSSAPNAEGNKIDADNRLLWRQNRQRLDFEEMRDSLLLAGGEIDPCTGGPPCDLTTEPFDRRRTVYGLIDRQNLPPMFRVFDFASPDSLSTQRYVTISPQQALFLMNSPFAVEQAIRLAEQIASQAGSDPAKRCAALYLRLLGRMATPGEASIATGYLQNSAQSEIGVAVKPEPVWSYGYGRYDQQLKRVAEFAPLKYWSGKTWMCGTVLPDPDLGNLFMTATGGGPGGDSEHAIIRRWTAPCSGTFTITGSIKHGGKSGDGITARIVSSRSGELGSWDVFSREQTVQIDSPPISAGDTIDFVAECRDNDLEDNFTWTPVIRIKSALPHPTLQAVSTTAALEWNAERDFAGPGARPRPLSVWEKYVQTLLLSNEFAFVD